MSPIAAVTSALRQYATFSGRATRSEFWYFELFIWLVVGSGVALDLALDTEWIGLALLIPLLLPSLTVLVRRLHDLDRSGWWSLIGLLPLVGPIVLFVFQVQRGTQGANRFGPSPSPALA